jgi:hypothetical protein
VRLRDTLRRLKREASEDAVLIRQRNGSVKAFDRMDVMAELYLAQLDAALRRPRTRQSAVMDALDNATPESREAVLRAHTGPFMADLEPADPDAPPVEDLSE